MRWMYERTADNSARFILGTEGGNPLICFGINPSTAEPGNLDPTVNYVSRLAAANGFDSFVMFNVYAQRATDPDNLHLAPAPELVEANERQIAAYIGGGKRMLWAAWGGLINKRPYLKGLVRRIVSLPELCNCEWVSRGVPTKDGHPHHPLYVKKDAPFEPFDISIYR